MTRFIIENRITNPDDLSSFCYEGFEYEPSLGALGPMGRLPEQEPDYPHFIKQ
jgi:hypothetical protein